MKHLTRDEERARHSHAVNVAIGLECHLRGLVREVQSGNAEKLIDFQQYIQYAPQPMRERIGVLVRREDKCQRM